MRTLLVLLLAGSPAFSHEATNINGPAGWNYPQACCSNRDCRNISREEIDETPVGYVINTLDNRDTAPIGYTDERVKDSPDGEYHWCAHPQGTNAGRTICLFVPPKGF